MVQVTGINNRRILACFYFVDFGKLLPSINELLNHMRKYFDEITFIRGRFMYQWSNPEPNQPKTPATPIAGYIREQWLDYNELHPNEIAVLTEQSKKDSF